MIPITYSTAAYTSKHWMDTLLHNLARCNHVFHLNSPGSSIYPLVSFPALTLLDGQSKIHLALFANEGQHKSQKTKVYLGAIRMLCANPMIFAKIPDLNLVDKGVFPKELPALLARLPDIRCEAQKRINWLQRLHSKKWHIQTISERISQDFSQRLQEQLKVSKLTQWQLLNLVTHHISREAEKSQQLELLRQASHIFKL